jgi:hypothetical protein
VPVTYTPAFQHTDWVDNVDRVQAAGDNGFNVRFHDLEDEFKTVADVVKVISDSLDALSATPPAQPVKLTLTPALVATGTAWEHVLGGALKAAGRTDAAGMMPVQLPHGNRVQSLRVTGSKQSGSLSVNLFRQALAGTAPPERITGVNPPTGSFDLTSQAPNTTVAKVDNDQFRYYLIAELDSATAAHVIALNGFQVTHIAE